MILFSEHFDRCLCLISRLKESDQVNMVEADDRSGLGLALVFAVECQVIRLIMRMPRLGRGGVILSS